MSEDIIVTIRLSCQVCNTPGETLRVFTFPPGTTEEDFMPAIHEYVKWWREAQRT